MSLRDRHITLVRMAAAAFETAAKAAVNAMPVEGVYPAEDKDGWTEDCGSVDDDVDKLREMARQWNDWANRLANVKQKEPTE